MTTAVLTSVSPNSGRAFETWEHEATSAHRGPCMGVARRLLRDEHMAEDAVQEAFLDAWRHRARFDSTRSTQRSWLLMMTRARAIDRIRREQRQRDDRLAAIEHQLASEAGRASASNPAEVIVCNERGAAVRAALRELPVAQRETLLLAYWGGYTQREIAAMTNTPLGTVKTRCLAGLRSLRIALGAARLLDQSIF